MVDKQHNHELTRGTIQLLKHGKKETCRQLIEELKPYDIAMLFSDIPTKHKPIFLEILTLVELTSLLRHLPKEEQLRVLKTIDPKRSTDILNLKKNDDLAFLLSNLPVHEVYALRD